MNIKRIHNECIQYGITPTKMVNRLFNKKAPKVLANSIPKSGTNLLLRALYLLPKMHRKFHRTLNHNTSSPCEIISNLKNGQICSAHLKYSDEIRDVLCKSDVKNIIIVRDPRDIAVSTAMYITYKDTNHRLSDYFINTLKNDHQRIMASIEGIPATNLDDGIESLSLISHYAGYMDWSKCRDCLFIKFEDLIGERGGGSAKAQSLCVQKIIDHIGINITDVQLHKVCKNIFNPTSRTFVKGQIGTWKKTLQTDHISKIKESMGSYLIQLDYETDTNW